jgi:transposase InsO family protein
MEYCQGKDKLQAVAATPPPENVHQVRQFLGLCNFFRTHIRNFSLLSGPLNKLTRKDCPWKGGQLPPEAFKAYKELKHLLVSEPIVDYPRKNRPYSLIVDAATGNDINDGGLGAILTQTDEQGKQRVIAYASRSLVNHEKNYTPFLLEMLAASWAMDYFDTYLKGRKFQLFTDHKPLEKLSTIHTKTFYRLQEQMGIFNFTIHYKKGSEMPADFLSRNVCEAINVFDSELPEMQKQDPTCKIIRDFIQNLDNPKANQEPFKNPKANTGLIKYARECFIQDDILWIRINKEKGTPRTVLFVPLTLREKLVQEAHGQLLSGHDGISKTKERLKESYFWPNMDADVAKHIAGCQKCQKRKDDRPQPTLLSPLPQCTAPNQRVHIDLFGPLKTSDKGKKMVLCMTDAFTKYVELVALTDKEAETTGEAIFNRWICRYGTPLEIVSDNGKEFRNKLATELYKRLDIEHTTTAAYHPQCNAQAEVCNKTIAKYLNSFVDESTLDWEQYLAPMAFSYNTSLHRSIQTTPYFLTYGQDARTPSFPSPDIQRCYSETPAGDWYNTLQMARDLATENNMKATTRAESDHNRKAQQHDYKVGQQIWLDERNFLSKNRKLAAKWSGPFVITKVRDNGNIRIKMERKEININVNRVKPFIATNPEPEQPQPEPQPAPQPENLPIIDTQPPEQPWVEVKRKQIPKAPALPADSKRGRGRPRKNTGPPKDKTVQFPPRWTRARAQQMREEQAQAQQAQGSAQIIEELIKTGNIAALIKLDQRRWDACLIKTGPSSYAMDDYGLPKQQSGVQQPDWVYKRRNYLKSLSVQERNLILTGDPAFSFDPVPYTVVYNYTYADIVRGPPAVIPAPAPAPAVVPAPAPAPAVVPAPAPAVVPAPAAWFQHQLQHQQQYQHPAPAVVPALAVVPPPAHHQLWFQPQFCNSASANSGSNTSGTSGKTKIHTFTFSQCPNSNPRFWVSRPREGRSN